MKPLDTGALVKEYETQDKETEVAAHMVITSIVSEDPRYVEKASLPLGEEFPIGTRVFFLGEQAYGTRAEISAATSTALSVILTVSGLLYLWDIGWLHNLFHASISRKTRARTKGSKHSSGAKLERGITLSSKLRRLSGSRQK